MNKRKLQDFLNGFLIFITIIYSNSPFFLNVTKQFWLILFSTLLLISIFKRRIVFNIKIILLLLVVWTLIILQGFAFGGYNLAAIYFPVLTFITPVLLIFIIGISYFKLFFKVIYLIAIITSIIYFLQVLVPSINVLINNLFDITFPYSWSDWPRSIIIYSAPRSSGYHFPRNSGLFHEPGAYAVYLAFAIIINTIITKKVDNYKNIILSLVLLTTFSTTGYIMLFILLIHALIVTKTHLIFKIPVLFIFVLFAIKTYKSNEFLENKISQQYGNQIEALNEGELDKRGRFYAFGLGLKAFLNSPLYGQGIITATKYKAGENAAIGYGFIGLFARFGLIFGLFYMFQFYKGFRYFASVYNTPNHYVLLSFIVLNIGLLTQAFFFHLQFVIFFIIGLLYYNRLSRHNIVNINSILSGKLGKEI